MFRLLGFFTWTTEAAPEPLAGVVNRGMLMVHGGYLRRSYRMRIQNEYAL